MIIKFMNKSKLLQLFALRFEANNKMLVEHIS